MNRVYNFSAGPAALPLSVLEEASRGVLEIHDSGMSILEVSHRGKDYEAVHFDAKSRVLKVLGLSEDDYEVMFVGGGASLQFCMAPMNFLVQGATADYVNTGDWSTRAIKEAKRYGNVQIVGSSETDGFSYIPKSLLLTEGARYLHITTNNTIEGTEYPTLPETNGIPLVGDLSSDIFARNLDYSRFSLLYAGAQKNAGAAGVTLVVARKDFLSTATDHLPTMLAYKTHVKNNSLYNTPPVFSVYVLGLVLKWIEAEGGLAVIEERNREKASLIYDALDARPDIFEPTVTVKEDRSLMNITFRLKDPSRDEEFLAGAKARNMDGLKGHRSVGGFRASVYNAFPIEGARALAEYLAEF